MRLPKPDLRPVFIAKDEPRRKDLAGLLFEADRPRFEISGSQDFMSGGIARQQEAQQA